MIYDVVRPKLVVHKGVYSPLEDSKMVSNAIEKYGFGKMLDLGTGTGIIGIVGALHGLEVTFADVNPNALECAKENCRINGAKGKFVQTDVFSNIKGKYNTICFNAPFLKSRPVITGRTNPATDGGRNGREVLERFLNEYKKHVLKEHVVFLTESWWNKYDQDIKRLDAKIVANRHYPLLGDCVVLMFK